MEKIALSKTETTTVRKRCSDATSAVAQGNSRCTGLSDATKRRTGKWNVHILYYIGRYPKFRNPLN